MRFSRTARHDGDSYRRLSDACVLPDRLIMEGETEAGSGSVRIAPGIWQPPDSSPPAEVEAARNYIRLTERLEPPLGANEEHAPADGEADAQRGEAPRDGVADVGPLSRTVGPPPHHG